MRTLKLFLLLVLVLVLRPSVLFAQAPASDDTFASPTSDHDYDDSAFSDETVGSHDRDHHGDSPFLLLQGPGSSVYVKFDLSRLPKGLSADNVSKATVRLFVSQVESAGSFDVKRVTTPWTERTLDFDNRPALGASEAIGVQLSRDSNQKYLIIDITALVKDWLNHVQPNYGIALVPAGPLFAAFDSKENENTSHDPELNVVIVSFGPQGPAGPQGPQGFPGATGPPGVAGKDGVRGPVGPAGPKGNDGAQGPQGVAGAIGPQGPAGKDGLTGPQGPQGPAGAPGTPGAQGLPGKDGINGTNGKDGAQGPPGPAGPVNYPGASSLAVTHTSFPDPSSILLDVSGEGRRDWFAPGGTTSAANYHSKLLGGQMMKSFDWVVAGQSLFTQPSNFSISSASADDATGSALSSFTTTQGVFTFGPNTGFGFRLNAPATQAGSRRLKIYCSAFSAGVTLTARLTDGSVADAVDLVDSGVGTSMDFIWTIDYQSARDGQELEVSTIVTSNHGNGPHIKFAAATLQ